MALEWLKQRYNEVSANLKTEVTKFKNKSFLEAVVARWWPTPTAWSGPRKNRK